MISCLKSSALLGRNSTSAAMHKCKWFVEKNSIGDIVVHPGSGHHSLMLKHFDTFQLDQQRIWFERHPPTQSLPRIRLSYDFVFHLDAAANYKLLNQYVAAQSKWPAEKAPYEDLFVDTERLIEAWKEKKGIDFFGLANEGIYFDTFPRNTEFPLKRLAYDYGSFERNKQELLRLERLALFRAAAKKPVALL